MFRRFISISKLFEENWRVEKLTFEKLITEDKITSKALVMNMILGSFISFILYFGKFNEIRNYFPVWIVIMITGFIIDKKGGVILNYFYTFILCLLISFNIIFLCRIFYLMDMSTVERNLFYIINFIFVLICPYLSYVYLINFWKKYLNLSINGKGERQNKWRFILAFIPGSLGLVVGRLMRDYLSNDFNSFIMVIVSSYLVILMVFLGFLFLYRGIMYWSVEKNSTRTLN